MSDLNRPTEPDRPYGTRRPAEPVPQQAPYDPVADEPVAYDAHGDVTAAPTNDPRLGLDVGRYWGGALATIIVAALIGVVAWFVVESVANQELHDPPFGEGAVSWAVAGGLLLHVIAWPLIAPAVLLVIVVLL